MIDDAGNQKELTFGPHLKKVFGPPQSIYKTMEVRSWLNYSAQKFTFVYSLNTPIVFFWERLAYAYQGVPSGHLIFP